MIRAHSKQIGTCLSLNFLTATRHGVIHDWPKLKIIIAFVLLHEYIVYLRAYSMRVCGFRVCLCLVCVYLSTLCWSICRHIQRCGVSCSLRWWWRFEKSIEICFDTQPPRIRCHFDANVSMRIARNIHAHRIGYLLVLFFISHVRIADHGKNDRRREKEKKKKTKWLQTAYKKWRVNISGIFF